MPTRWTFGDLVQKLMRSHEPPLNNSQLADRADINPNTVSDLVNGRYSPSVDTQNKVATALGMTREQILAEVDRLNAAENVIPLRSGKDREEDKDPVLREAMDYARRIVRLDPLARMSVYSFVAQLEQWFERVRRAEERDAERNNRKP